MKHIHLASPLIAAVYISLISPISVQAQDMYKSKDASGKPVYSDKPPNGPAARIVVRPVPPSSEPTITQPQNGTVHREPSAAESSRFFRSPQNRCNWLKDQMHMMKPDPRAKYAEMTDEYGKKFVYGTPEYEAKLRAIEAEASEVCRTANQSQ